METIISYHSVLQFSLAPLLVLLHFGSHFQILVLIVVFHCRNRFPDTVLCMAAVAKAAVTSKFDLSCRPRSAQGAFIANTRDASTNLMPRFEWSSANSVRSTFDDNRYSGVYYTRHDLDILCYQQYSMTPGTKGQSTFHRIR